MYLSYFFWEKTFMMPDQVYYLDKIIYGSFEVWFKFSYIAKILFTEFWSSAKLVPIKRFVITMSFKYLVFKKNIICLFKNVKFLTSVESTLPSTIHMVIGIDHRSVSEKTTLRTHY